MADIFQNCNYKYSKSKQYHEFFVCTHRKRLLPFKARNGGIHTLSAPWLSILNCHGADIGGNINAVVFIVLRQRIGKGLGRFYRFCTR